MKQWPATQEPARPYRFQKGDRVRFHRQRGTVVDAWRGGDSFTEPGEDFLRIEFDNCQTWTIPAKEVRPA